ncbi:MAG: SH3 domain-containing protein [Acidobacteriota bacterium]
MKRADGKLISWASVVMGLTLAFPGVACAESICKNQVNVRSGPSLQSDVIYQAPLGYPIKIEEKRKDWVLFRDWENNMGWAHRSIVSVIDTVVLLADNVNVRSSAGLKYDVVGKAMRGQIYKVISRSDEWVQLAYYANDEPFGWVRSDLVFGD